MFAGLHRIFWLVWVVVFAACTSTPPLPTPMVLPSPLPTHTASAIPNTKIALLPTIPTATATASPSSTATLTLPPTATASSTNTASATHTATLTSTFTATSAPTFTATPQGDALVANADGVNLRSGPGLEFEPPLLLLPQNTPLKILANSANFLWYKVITPEGKQGWVFSRSLTILHEPPNLPVEVVAIPTKPSVMVAQQPNLAMSPLAPQSISAGGGVSGGNGSGLAMIDLMVLYTTQVRDANGGDAVVQQNISMAVTAANRAFMYSGVNARFRLVHSQVIEMDDNGQLIPILHWFSQDSAVATLRDTYQADIVSLIVQNTADKGGRSMGVAGTNTMNIAEMSRYGFNVIVYSAVAGGSNILVHEIGHNMGLSHDIKDAPNAAFSDAHGYHDPNGRFQDIMAAGGCKQPCPQIQYFSNPNLYFGNTPMGDNTANAVRVLNYMAPYVAQYRTGSPSFVLPTTTPVPLAAPVLATVATPPPPPCTITAADPATLTNAIIAANADAATLDVICLTAQGIYTVLGSEFPTISTPIIIVGNGATLLRTGAIYYRFFNIVRTGTLTVYDLTLQNGAVEEHGGTIANNGGNLTLYNVTIKDSLSGKHGQGGAVYALFGTTRIFNSRFEGNTAVQGGAIAIVGGTAEIAASVLFRNAGQYGSALYATSRAVVDIHNSCLMYNARISLLVETSATTINATNNWWGSSTGPFVVESLIATTADVAGNYVISAPYLTQPASFCPAG